MIVAMEASQQPLSIESFSYSWLLNLKQPSFEGGEGTGGSSSSLRGSLDASDFIEMDPRLPASRRFKIRRSSQDFNFAFPTSSDSPITLVHADELISGGLLMPLFINQHQLRMEEEGDQEEEEVDHSSTPSDPVLSRNNKPAVKIRCSSLGRCTRMSKRIFWKYFSFFRPFCQKLRNQRSGSRVEAVDATTNQVYNSTATSPRESSATYYSTDNWRRSCDSESSIYEAVLHCKRSIGKDDHVYQLNRYSNVE